MAAEETMASYSTQPDLRMSPLGITEPANPGPSSQSPQAAADSGARQQFGDDLPRLNDHGQPVDIGVATSSENAGPEIGDGSTYPYPLRNPAIQNNRSPMGIASNPEDVSELPHNSEGGLPLPSNHTPLHGATASNRIQNPSSSHHQLSVNVLERHRYREVSQSDNRTGMTKTREQLLSDNVRLEDEVQRLRRALYRSAQQASTGERPAKQQPEGDYQNLCFTTLRELINRKLFATSSLSSVIPNPEAGQLGLDTPLTPSQARYFQQLVREIVPSPEKGAMHGYILCGVCSLPKFAGTNRPSQSLFLSILPTRCAALAESLEDFHPHWAVTRCCRKYICNSCFARTIIKGIYSDWWFSLARIDVPWLKCPMPNCEASLPLKYKSEVLGVLSALGVPDAVAHVDNFRSAGMLRSILHTKCPSLSREETRRAIALHDRLREHSKMWKILEAPSMHRNPCPHRIEVLPVDTADGQHTMKIPILIHLLRPIVKRECIVCAETWSEFERGTAEEWQKASQGFPGEWAWRILIFPAKELVPECHHELDICRICIAKHISAQLETYGCNAVDHITCPTPDCEHTYTYSEIRDLAELETFEIYDRFAVLNAISQFPNFRWCLREGCTAGGLYDISASTNRDRDRDRDSTKIMCSECGFAMCYACQIPWHRSLSCAQYKSLTAHSDPQTAASQVWIAQHTKNCPGAGCGAPIQKGNGCFHMTCSACKFEFCWECLADWKEIVVGGEFRIQGHRAGCYFRDETAVLPTQVVGRDLERALNHGPQ